MKKVILAAIAAMLFTASASFAEDRVDPRAPYEMEWGSRCFSAMESFANLKAAGYAPKLILTDMNGRPIVVFNKLGTEEWRLFITNGSHVCEIAGGNEFLEFEMKAGNLSERKS